jgi:ABC-2 type transport system ATP-binding protein
MKAMTPVIELKKVTKMYGSSVGIKNISLSVLPGDVFGFLGPNGAGKTTTISMLIDLIRPTSGKINLFGLDSVTNSYEIRARVGFLAGDFALDRGLSGWQQLEYFGNIRGNFDKTYVRELAERLSCNLNRKIKTLSRGNKQKIGLISALMHKPELLILDEPTDGLDPLVQAEFNKIIREHSSEGKTAFVSSHVLSEVQAICDQVAFIREGELITSRSVLELSAGLPREVQIISGDKQLKAALGKLSGFSIASHKDQAVEGSYTGDINKLLAVLAHHKINNLHVHDADLETIFMKFYEK